MDYRALLKKYIASVEAVEGTHFLDGYKGYPGDPTFTAEEWAELQALVAEIPDP